MTRIKSTFLLSIALLLPFTTYAWNAVGHMVIATIAYQNLKPEPRHRIDNLINYFHNEYNDISTFIQIVTWPDMLRSQKIEMFTHWHYIDKPFSTDGTKLVDIVDDDNAIWALDQVRNVVKYQKANNYERARFLAFYAHIISDLHQPLHTVSDITALHPNGDKGGNLYTIRYKGERSNLHRLWDSGVGFLNGNLGTDNIKTLANAVMARYPKKSLGAQADDLNPQHWLEEGMENAKQYVYDTPENGTVSAIYIERGSNVAQKEVALAGYRLATLLNEALG